MKATPSDGNDKPLAVLPLRRVHVSRAVERRPMGNGMVVEFETSEHTRIEAVPCEHESHYMTEDDGHDHWRCLRCGRVTECGTCALLASG